MSKKQDKLEGMIKEQNNQIGEILSRSQFDSKVEDTKGKGKGKGKKQNDKFYLVNIHALFIIYNVFLFTFTYHVDAIKKLSAELFREHNKHLNDDELKARLATMLNDDDYCAKQLQRLLDNGYMFDWLWDEKLYSTVSIQLILISKFNECLYTNRFINTNLVTSCKLHKTRLLCLTY